MPPSAIACRSPTARRRLLAARQGVERGAEMGDDFGDIGAAALAALDLQRRHARRLELREDRGGVEADRLLEQIGRLAARQQPALARRRIGGVLGLGVAVRHHLAEARHHLAAFLAIGDELGRRADAVAARRAAGDVGRQIAAPLDHGAEAAEGEHLRLDLHPRDQRRHFLDRQHARQHHPADAERFAIEVDRQRVRSRRLHRQVTAQAGMAARGVVEQADVGEDHRVGAGGGGGVDRASPRRRDRRRAERC